MKNTGNNTLEFFITSTVQDGQTENVKEETRWLRVDPRHGTLDSEKAIDMSIKCYPRITGEFRVSFLLEVLLIYVNKKNYFC